MLGRGKYRSLSRDSWGLFYLPRITGDQGLFAAEGFEDLFTGFLRALEKFTRQPVPKLMYDRPDDAINSYVQNYDMVIVMIDTDGQKRCYSVSPRNQLPTPFLDRVRATMGVQPSDVVLWSDSVFKAPREASAREVIYGHKPEKPPRRLTKAERKAKIAQGDPLSPDELDYLTGKSQEPPK